MPQSLVSIFWWWFFSSATFVPSAGTYPGWLFEVEEDMSYLVIFKVGFVVFGTHTTTSLLGFLCFFRQLKTLVCLEIPYK